MNYRPMFVTGGPRDLGLLAAELIELARTGVRRSRERRRALAAAGRWRCLQAGRDTPLWNALAQAVVTRLRRRGAKAQLARMLGLSRQRLHLLLVAKRAYPDAERALLLLCWLHSGFPRRPPPRHRPAETSCHLLNDKPGSSHLGTRRAIQRSR